MRIIFSRKGFDSAAGGCPSPLIEGRPYSLPIPTRMPSDTRYRDLGEPYVSLVSVLSRGRVSSEDRCHLDPDIDAGRLRRSSGWRGSLGQVGAAQGHLDRHGVGRGDVFLFWGLFRALSGDRFTGPCEHRIFGWLQVGEVEHAGSDARPLLKRHPWLRDHPHVADGWPENNTIYIAQDRLILDGKDCGLPGWGMLNPGRRLTAHESRKPSVWQVPRWIHPGTGGTGLTYHPPERWLGLDLLQSAPRGQEFIADAENRADAVEWLVSLLGEDA